MTRNAERRMSSTSWSSAMTALAVAGSRLISAPSAAAQHAPHLRSHLADLEDVRQRRVLRRPPGRIRDVDRVVADPLDVPGRPEHGEHEAKVAGHGVLKGQKLQRALIDLDVEVVDPVVGPADQFRPVRISLLQRLHGQPHQLLRPPRDLQEQVVELVELELEGLLEGRVFRHGIRPVR